MKGQSHNMKLPLSVDLHALTIRLPDTEKNHPVKAGCAAMGFGKYILRLPLVEMEEGNRQKLLELMRQQGIEV